MESAHRSNWVLSKLEEQMTCCIINRERVKVMTASGDGVDLITYGYMID